MVDVSSSSLKKNRNLPFENGPTMKLQQAVEILKQNGIQRIAIKSLESTIDLVSWFDLRHRWGQQGRINVL